jgi:hypothetical protein
MRVSTWLLVGLCFLAWPSLAQAPATIVDSVEVKAKKNKSDKEKIDEYVEAVSVNTSNRRLGRWDKSICPFIDGIKSEYQNILRDRIVKAAKVASLTVDPPGCPANLYVSFTADSNALVKAAIDKDSFAFSKYDLGMTAGRTAFKKFISTPAPVRWWFVSARVTVDGETFISEAGEPPPMISADGVLRNKPATREDFSRAIVIVDTTRVGKIEFGALCDYIAYISVAQVDPNFGGSQVPSILNLFLDREAGKPPVLEISDWDKSYLSALYEAPREVNRGHVQMSAIKRRMAAGILASPKR